MENFQLFRKNGRIMKPKEQRKGRILFWDRQGDGITNRPHICILNRNSYVWKDLRELSGPRFQGNRVKISDNLSEMYKVLRREVNSHNLTKRKLNTAYHLNSEMFAYMFNKMNPIDRQKFILNFPDQKERISNITCKVCSNVTSKPFVKCRHKNCSKMCQNCSQNWKNDSSIKNGMFVFGHLSCNKDTCPACKQSQLYECPICYDNCKKEHIMFSDNCDHYICKNCFCNSFNSNPIVDCPMCRKQFKKTLSKTTYNDGAPEAPIIV